MKVLWPAVSDKIAAVANRKADTHRAKLLEIQAVQDADQSTNILFGEEEGVED